ncbi:M13 family metallopeptidase [Butyrivibrio hungatei]|uniref:Peptidase M13 family n=1 Tax=Butyrivibrio hungatei TaxID=185008 RepID=A0A1D9P0U2_9FIRM|nr:M13 family metallopeptidase [Butyrivibrio hungatei]AOZ95805.1 peptidase M13 family [Butyrivibrio hungatei]
MRENKWNIFRRTTSVFLMTALILVSVGCGDGSDETEDVSGTPGGGKWVDSDVIGVVGAKDNIRLQDDFAAAANKDYILSAVIDPAYEEASIVLDASKLIYERCMAIASDDTMTGANAEKYKSLVKLYSDWDERNKLGVEPLKKYISDIQSISSISELTDYQGSLEKNPFGLGLLIPDSIGPQLQFPDKSTLNLKAPALSLGSASSYVEYTSNTLAAKERCDDVIGYYLGRLGFSEKEIKDIIKGNYRIETYIARNSNMDYFGVREMITQAQNNREGIDALQGGYPLLQILDSRGYLGCDSFYVDYTYLKSLSGIYSEKNLKDIKAFLIVHTIDSIKYLLDRESYEKMVALYNPSTGSQEGLSDGQCSVLFRNDMKICGFLPLLDTLYLEKYFKDSKKTDRVEEFTDALIKVYSQILDEEDWMSEDTKTAAKEKLQNMALHLVKPDNVADYSAAEIRSYEEGGNLVEAAAEGRRMLEAHRAAISKNPDWDRFKWDIYDTGKTTTEVNCVYYTGENGIYIMAGYLAMCDAAFGEDASLEQFAGIVGTTIGHEITHGFDSNGTKFDLYGRQFDENIIPIDWMAVQDRSKMDEKASKLAGYFSLARPIPGMQKVNGNNIKDEAIADMGGIKSVLYVARDLPDFDYDEFFRAFARQYAQQTTKESELGTMRGDVHPLPFLRINIMLQQYDEFIETYDIKPGDGMYLNPEKRVNVW